MNYLNSKPYETNWWWMGWNPPISIQYRLTLNLKIFWILALISIFSLLAIYVFQINSLISQNYTVTSYEKKIDQVSQENKILEINFSKANSLNNLETHLLSQNFEKVNQVKYIQILETPIASK